MTMTVLLITLLGALAVGLPIAYALLLSGLVTIYVASPGISAGMLAQYLITANDSFPIMAIPFFVLAGLIMGKGGISKRLFHFANSLVGNIRGGVGIAAVITAMFFSAISGSGPATVAAIGAVMIPEMVRQGYSKRFAGALIAAAGTIGIVIPPSIPLVIFGVVTGASIGDLFKAAMIPGLLMGVALVVWVLLYAHRNDLPRLSRSTWKERGAALVESLWGLLLPVIILGGIYGGVFTPTEASVVAVVYALIISLFVYREMTWRDLAFTLNEGTLFTSALMLIVAAAATFSLFLTIEEAPQKIVAWMTSNVTNTSFTILLIVGFLLLLGTFMETIAATTIVSPILVPVLVAVGMDPVHVGVVTVLILSIGLITPPLGVNLFVAASTAKVRVQELVTAVTPGVVALIIVGLIVAFVPVLSMGFVN